MWLAHGVVEGDARIAADIVASTFDNSWVRRLERRVVALSALAVSITCLIFALGVAGVWGEWLYSTCIAVTVAYILLLKILHSQAMEHFKENALLQLHATLMGYEWTVEGMVFAGFKGSSKDEEDVLSIRGGAGGGGGGMHAYGRRTQRYDSLNQETEDDVSLTMDLHQTASSFGSAYYPPKEDFIIATCANCCGPFRTDPYEPASTCPGC